MRISFVIVPAVLVAGCSTNPNKIEPAYVSALKYRQYSCADIDTEITAIDGRTSVLQKKLRKRTYTNVLNMTAGMVLGWPAMLLAGGGGTTETEYSQLKGERDALLRGRANCTPTDIALKDASTSGANIVSRDAQDVMIPMP